MPNRWQDGVGGGGISGRQAAQSWRVAGGGAVQAMSCCYIVWSEPKKERRGGREGGCRHLARRAASKQRGSPSVGQESERAAANGAAFQNVVCWLVGVMGERGVYVGAGMGVVQSVDAFCCVSQSGSSPRGWAVSRREMDEGPWLVGLLLIFLWLPDSKSKKNPEKRGE